MKSHNYKIAMVTRLNSAHMPKAIPCNEIRMWAYALGGDILDKSGMYGNGAWYTPQYQDYDLLMVERIGMEDFIEWAIERGLPVMVIEEGPLNVPKSLADVASYAKLWRSAKAVGAINSGNDVDVISSYTDKPVINADLPYPVEYTDKLVIPRSERNGKVSVFSSFSTGSNTIFDTALVARCPDIQFVTYAIPYEIDQTKAYYNSMGIKNIEVRAAGYWTDFIINEFRYMSAAVCLDPRISAGRTIRDAAALGVPCVCNENSPTAENLFWTLRTNIYDIEEAEYNLRRALDENMNVGMISQAYDKLKTYYDVDMVADRFISALEKNGVLGK